MLKGETVLLRALELIGNEWEENYRPEDIRLSEQKIDLLLQVKSLVDDPGGSLTRGMVLQLAPTFADQFQQVLMREL